MLHMLVPQPPVPLPPPPPSPAAPWVLPTALLLGYSALHAASLSEGAGLLSSYGSDLSQFSALGLGAATFIAAGLVYENAILAAGACRPLVLPMWPCTGRALACTRAARRARPVLLRLLLRLPPRGGQSFIAEPACGLPLTLPPAHPQDASSPPRAPRTSTCWMP